MDTFSYCKLTHSLSLDLLSSPMELQGATGHARGYDLTSGVDGTELPLISVLRPPRYSALVPLKNHIWMVGQDAGFISSVRPDEELFPMTEMVLMAQDRSFCIVCALLTLSITSSPITRNNGGLIFLGGLDLAIEGPSKAEINCVDNKDGTCSVSYLPTLPGDYNILVKYNEDHIPGSPFTARITGETHTPTQSH